MKERKNISVAVVLNDNSREVRKKSKPKPSDTKNGEKKIMTTKNPTPEEINNL